jgi:filamentous hemagglutinin family protein
MHTSKFVLSIVVGTNVLMGLPIAQAQTYQPSNRIPVSDGTLGTQFTRSNNNFIIDGGVRRGQQLFHSFEDFSVPTGGAATFIRPAGNQSIITRVTGNLFSDINGLVDTQGANFLLINPNGVVFGPNIQLNVGQSFTASTANGVDLVDGGGRTITFGTSANGDAPFLAIDPNVFFNVSRLNMGGGRGEIRNFGTLQTGNPNQYIGLIGGNVSIDGGQINTPGGRVELGGLSDVSLTNQARISVAGSGGGDIAINAQKIELLGGSVVRGGIEEGQGNPAAIAGDIKINGTGAVVIDGESTIANNVRLNASGNGGNTTINTGSLSVRNNSQIQSSTSGQGHAGNITLTAQDSITLDGIRILSLVTAEGMGNSGSLSVTANSLSITNNALLTSSILGQGNAGNITLAAKDAIFLSNVGVFNSVEAGGIGKSGNLSVTTNSLSLADRSSLLSSTFGAGNSGNVTVTANSLSLTGGSSLASSTFGKGNAGNVTVIATDTVALNAANILSSVGTGAIGKGGNIHLQARSLSLLDSTLIAASLGEGNAGNVVVTTQDSLLLSGRSAITSSVGTMGVGTGGNIDINTRLLSLQDGASLTSSTEGQGNAGGVNIQTTTISLANNAFISANTFSRGNAGNIQIDAQDAITLVNARISNSIGAEGVGKGGNILINAGSLSLQDGSFLSSATDGQGNAGNIDVTVSRAINIFGTQDSRKSGISSAIGPGAQGNGGNITINPGTLALRDGAFLLTSTFGRGDAGNVVVKAKDIVSLADQAVISSAAFSEGIGNGGNINITAKSISLSNGAQLHRWSGTGGHHSSRG